MSKEFLARQTRTARNSEEWSRIEYSLQLAIGSTAPVVTNIWNIASAHITASFDRRTDNMTVLDSWIDSNSLDENNRLEEISITGFKVPNSGYLISTGAARLESGMNY